MMTQVKEAINHITSTLKGKRHLLWLSFAVLYLALSSCDTPEKVMKSPDVNYKLKVATDWYNKKQYYKCIPIFEELMGLMKGQKSTEDIYFMYCMANFYQGDYMLAAYHFKNFASTYPNSKRAEEAVFMSAMGNYKLSPKYELDQTYTNKAIDGCQSFINQYPDSKLVDSANKVITTLRRKLERKAISNAELYFKTGNFKAAAVSFENLLVQYPDIDNSERIYFMIVKAYDKYAENSVALKSVDRYHTVSTAYQNLAYKFPKSKYKDEAAKYEQAAHYNAANAAYDRVFVYVPSEREKQFMLTIKECNTQLPLIKDPDQVRKTNEIIEKCYFGIVKVNFELSEEESDSSRTRLMAKKLNYLDKTVKSYYNFVDKYRDGKYFREAEKLFAMASDKLAKIKQDGQKQKD